MSNEIEPYRSSPGIEPYGHETIGSPTTNLNLVERIRARHKLSKFQQEKLEDLLAVAGAVQKGDLLLRLSDETLGRLIEASNILERRQEQATTSRNAERLQKTFEVQYERTVTAILGLEDDALKSIRKK